MKKLLYTTLLMASSASLFSQSCPANDSTEMGSGNDVYYSLKHFDTTGHGVVKVVPNNNWHLAISVQASNFPANPANGVAIRYNAPFGENPQTGATGWTVVKLPNANPSNWRSIDTTGLYTLPELLDSDSTWNLSAFTAGYPVGGNPFNFGWGTYNQTTHNVESNGVVYILYNKTAGTNGIYKKIHVKELAYDTLWNIIISNVDNSDSVNLSISKMDYPKRLFVYYDVVNDMLYDREPDNDKWDLVWTKYRGMIDFMGTKVPYNVTGVLSNNGIKIAKNLGKKCPEVWLANKTAAYANSISTLGWDWKTFNNSTFKYDITDTFVYFINKTTSSDTANYKMTMKSFGSGKSTFNFYKASLGLSQANTLSQLIVYPNPANNVINIQTERNIESVMVYDLQGRIVLTGYGSSINISNLQSGVYVLVVKTGTGLHQQTFVKE